MESDEIRIQIRIEFNDFITRMDLDEILRSIDGIIELELYRHYLPKSLPYLIGRHALSRAQGQKANISFLGIRSVENGSLLIVAFIGGSVLTYVGKRFARGVDDTALADELRRSGRLTGNAVASLLKRINDWAESHVDWQRERGGNITKVTAELEPPKDEH